MGVGIGGPAGNASAALELRKTGVSNYRARQDIYQDASGDIVLKLSGNKTASLIVKNDGVYLQWGTKTPKKIIDNT